MQELTNTVAGARNYDCRTEIRLYVTRHMVAGPTDMVAGRVPKLGKFPTLFRPVEKGRKEENVLYIYWSGVPTWCRPPEKGRKPGRGVWTFFPWVVRGVGKRSENFLIWLYGCTLAFERTFPTFCLQFHTERSVHTHQASKFGWFTFTFYIGVHPTFDCQIWKSEV